jgi:hypothetical protein
MVRGSHEPVPNPAANLRSAAGSEPGFGTSPRGLVIVSAGFGAGISESGSFSEPSGRGARQIIKFRDVAARGGAR